jgi:predicted DNA-binding transcriptional regulator YafY
MPALSTRRLFEVLVAVLALVEERRSIPLADAAAAVGIDVEDLRPLLDEVLYLEYHDTLGVTVDVSGAFLLDEGVLSLTDEHWLRNLAAEPPSAQVALQLLVACTVARSMRVGPQRALDTAMTKLERLVAAAVVVPVERLPLLEVCERAHAQRQTLQIRYIKDGATDATDREIEPWGVFSNWGNWYVHGADRGNDAGKWFRVDRMVTAVLGEHHFEIPEGETEIPEIFDLDEYARVVRVRIDPAALDGLPTPNRLGPQTETADGRVEVDITVYGDRRLENLLVGLPAGTEVLEPAEYASLRRETAAALLARYR